MTSLSKRTTGVVSIAMAFVLGAASMSAAATAPPETPSTSATAATQPKPVAAASPTYSVTVAARQCPTYPDIMANRARNNIMESLQDLGNDSNYSGGAAVSPTNEQAVSAGQSNCTPLTNWDFKLGTGIGGKDSSPSTYGQLSKVSNPYSTVVKTQASVPLLNSAGVATGGTLAGATTVELTAAQITAATQRKLWIQGGVPGQPLNGSADKAFGALRCAIDNYNGDNVEWIGFPTGAVHVFCYAYYVAQAPTSGTIKIVKNVTGPAPSGQTFNFGGDTSYNPDGVFSLKDGQDISFVREAGIPWTVNEALPTSGFSFTQITCDTGTYVVDNPNREVAITLAAGQTITCTFENAGPVPTGRLDIEKITEGSVGGFLFNIVGQGDQSATTTTEGDAVLATGFDSSALPLGPYTVNETLPPTTAAGTWANTNTECFNAAGDDVAHTGSDGTFSLTLAEDTICFVTNTFSPQGKIIIRAKETGPGSFNPASAKSTYVVSDPNAAVKTQVATNTGFNSYATAAPQSIGDETTDLGFKTYTIAGVAPRDTSTGSWKVDSVTCDGGSPLAIDEDNLFVQLSLAEDDPTVTCDFVYLFVPAPGSLPQVPNKCATPVRGPRVSGIATVIACQARTNVGKVRWRVSCTPRGRQLSTRGDFAYCRGIFPPDGRVLIRTFGYRVNVRLQGYVPASGMFKAWGKLYRWIR